MFVYSREIINTRLELIRKTFQSRNAEQVSGGFSLTNKMYHDEERESEPGGGGGGGGEEPYGDPAESLKRLSHNMLIH